MKKYIDTIEMFIEKPRNELRREVARTNDQELAKLLEEYELAYYQSCLKIDEMIEKELVKRGLKSSD